MTPVGNGEGCTGPKPQSGIYTEPWRTERQGWRLSEKSKYLFKKMSVKRGRVTNTVTLGYVQEFVICFLEGPGYESALQAL